MIYGNEPCDCCGGPWRSDCVIGYLCRCGHERCVVCQKCHEHCQCPGGYKTAEQRITEKIIARLECLEAALKLYADENNWLDVIWIKDDRQPWKIAQAALNKENK